MYKLTKSNEEKPDFTPFTLNIRLTSKGSARRLYEMLEPIVYSRPDGDPVDVVIQNMDGEQRQLAEDLCNMLSANVENIKEEH